MIVAIIITVYALSAIGMWRYIHLSHGPNGLFKWAKLTHSDIFITLCPGLNTIANVMWFEWPIRKADGSSSFVKKFFRIK
jgi:hypothetical protein